MSRKEKRRRAIDLSPAHNHQGEADSTPELSTPTTLADGPANEKYEDSFPSLPESARPDWSGRTANPHLNRPCYTTGGTHRLGVYKGVSRYTNPFTNPFIDFDTNPFTNFDTNLHTNSCPRAPSPRPALLHPSTLVTADLGPLTLLQTKVKPFRLLDLPDDVLNTIIHILVLSHRSSRLSLVLTCMKLHALKTASYTQIAMLHAKEVDPIAAVLFEPKADWQLLRDWMPRFLSRTSQIQQLLQLCEEACKCHQERPESENPISSHLYGVFRMGLYFVGLMHFQHNEILECQYIENFINRLPAAGLLLVRTTSMIMTHVFRYHYQDKSYFLQAVRQGSDTERTSWALTKLLLIRGLRWPVFRLDHWEAIESARSSRDSAEPYCDPLLLELSAIVRVNEYSSRLSEQHPVRLKLERKRCDLRVSERIATEYPEDVGSLSDNWERVDLLLDKISDWRGERSDLEVLMEVKIATGLPHS